MLGGPLSISCSSCAQKAAACRPQSRQWGARAFRSCAQRSAQTRARRGSSPREPRDSDAAPGG
eukprot:2488497-Prymnesium_polylepis.1